MAKNNFVENIIKFILSRTDDELGELTIKKITFSLKISRYHLYHTFQNEMHSTPGQYLSKIKILRSALLLKTSRLLSIKKIAGKFGFSSSDYFIKIFKEQWGTTPGKYRQYAQNAK